MTHPDFARAARHITPEAVRDTLIDMVNIASPTGRERPLAEYIVGRLLKAGFRAHLQNVSENRPNAVGVRPGSGDGVNLMFTGHMDTSYDGDEDYLHGDGHKAKSICRDGWVWGLGANNMKSGSASALVAVEAICRENIDLRGDLLYGAVVGETEKAPVDEFSGTAVSGYGVGTRHMVLHGISADYAILCEPTNLRVCTANMGVIWAKISAPGLCDSARQARARAAVVRQRSAHGDRNGRTHHLGFTRIPPSRDRQGIAADHAPNRRRLDPFQPLRRAVHYIRPGRTASSRCERVHAFGG